MIDHFLIASLREYWDVHLAIATFLNLWVWGTVIGWMWEIEPKAEPLNLHSAPPEPTR